MSKNTMATNPTKNLDDRKSGSSCPYVKVSMVGAPYIRNVDLKTYSYYVQLSSALDDEPETYPPYSTLEAWSEEFSQAISPTTSTQEP
ncbi:hypothetical protein Vadar_032369 [Vaccinium darrowii]|uniref:Uncharacterized protein n=1 Tax=Vaccinium darrowii TaxID=229202 RepID=A0ACB7XDS4_9ERIC|nr:hypothetical protein Vadar_032369 [Vaccinium darrowii]